MNTREYLNRIDRAVARASRRSEADQSSLLFCLLGALKVAASPTARAQILTAIDGAFWAAGPGAGHATSAAEERRRLVAAARRRDGDRCRICGVETLWMDTALDELHSDLRRSSRAGAFIHRKVNGVDRIFGACRACAAGESAPGGSSRPLLLFGVDVDSLDRVAGARDAGPDGISAVDLDDSIAETRKVVAEELEKSKRRYRESPQRVGRLEERVDGCKCLCCRFSIECPDLVPGVKHGRLDVVEMLLRQLMDAGHDSSPSVGPDSGQSGVDPTVGEGGGVGRDDSPPAAPSPDPDMCPNCGEPYERHSSMVRGPDVWACYYDGAHPDADDLDWLGSDPGGES